MDYLYVLTQKFPNVVLHSGKFIENFSSLHGADITAIPYFIV